MLSDAISLWKSARQTVGGAVNSMTSALEQLDASGTEDIAQELEVYKDQLADAQMQHFELSKQMRLLLAEKDAEIKVLREKSASDNNGDESSIIEQTRIEMEKSKFEKDVIKIVHDNLEYFQELPDSTLTLVINENGEIIIEPQFECASHFYNGIASVTYDCYLYYDLDNHLRSESENSFEIDKKGNRIE